MVLCSPRGSALPSRVSSTCHAYASRGTSASRSCVLSRCTIGGIALLGQHLASWQRLGHRLLGCFGLGLLASTLLHTPVEDVVVLEPFPNKQVSEEFSQVRVVGLVVEAKGAAAVEVDCHLRGESTAEELGWCGHLLLHDAVVLLLLGGRLESLPRQRSTQEVHENVAEGLEVISSRLLDTQVSVDGSVSSSSSQVLVLPVWDVQVGLWVAVLLGETKVNDVDLVSSLSDSHEEIVWLDISVNEVARVDVLDARDHLVCQEKDRLERELSVAEVEEILEGGSQKVDDHCIVVALLSIPPYKGNADASSESLVDLCFILELRVLGFDALELDGDFFAGDDVDAEVDVAEGSRADLLTNSVLRKKRGREPEQKVSRW